VPVCIVPGGTLWVINIKADRNAACMGDINNTYKTSIDISECKKRRWWFKRRWEDNINMDRKEVGCDDVNWDQV
jgi:hypothetical protein